MPNWCANDGWISPRTEEGKALFEKLKQFNPEEKQEGEIGWMSLVLSCPAEMWLGVKENEQDMNVETKEEYFSLEWLQKNSAFKGDFGSFSENEKGKKSFEATDEYRKYLLENFKACNWYQWGLENWGVKWDVFPDVYELDEENNKITFSFLSAWCDPMYFFEWLGNHGIDFERTYDEPGQQFVGRQIYKDGKEVENSGGMEDEYYLWKLKEWSHLYGLEDLLWLSDYTSYEDFTENGNHSISNEELIAMVKEYYQNKETSGDKDE